MNLASLLRSLSVKYSYASHNVLISAVIAAALLHVFFFVNERATQKWADIFVGALKNSKEQQLQEEWGIFFQWQACLKSHTPENAIIIVPPKNLNYPEIGNEAVCGYFLFPRIIIHEEELGSKGTTERPIYRVSMPGFEMNDAGLERYVCDEKLSLLKMRDGLAAAVEHPVTFAEISVSPFGQVRAIIVVLLLLGSGLYVALTYFRERSYIGIVCTSFLTGCIFITVFCILCSLVRVKFTQPVVLMFLSAMSLPGMIKLLRDKSLLWVQVSKPRGSIQGIAFAGTLVILLFGYFFTESMAKPILAWDACAIWGAKAQSIYALKSLKGLAVWGAWPTYPPMVPIVMAQLAKGADPMMKMLFPLFALCLYANIYEVCLRTRISRAWQISAPLLLLVSVIFFDHSTLGYANLALAVFTTKALTLLSENSADEGANIWPALMIMCCGVILVRPEGPIFCAIIIATAMSRIRIRKWPTYAAYLLIPATAFVIWQVYCAFVLAVATPELYSLKDNLAGITLPNLKTMAVLIVKFGFDVRSWGLIPFAFGLLLVLRWRSLFRTCYYETFFLMLGVTWVACFSVYVAPNWGIPFYFTTGFGRYVMPAMAAMFIAILKQVDILIHERTAA